MPPLGLAASCLDWRQGCTPNCFWESPERGQQIHAHPKAYPSGTEGQTASNSRDDVVMDAGEQSGSGAESGWSGVSNNSSTDSECTILEASSVASDQDRFDHEPMRRSVICLQDCMTLTPRGTLGVLPARMRLVSSWRIGEEKLRDLVAFASQLAIGAG